MIARDLVKSLQRYYDCDNAERLAVISEYLKKRSEKRLQQLLKLIYQECRYMPTVAEIRELEKRIIIPQVPQLEESPLTEQESGEIQEILKSWQEEHNNIKEELHQNLKQEYREPGSMISDLARICKRDSKREALREQDGALGISAIVAGQNP